MKRKPRPNVDQYFLKIASVVSERSTCCRHHVGAVAVRDNHILATGYNGAAAGMEDCLTLGCLRNGWIFLGEVKQEEIESGTMHEVCRAIHAEQNVIIQASLHGVSLKGATIYCTHTPCILCAKMLVNSRIKRFVSFRQYADDSFEQLFADAGIGVDILRKPSSQISHLE